MPLSRRNRQASIDIWPGFVDALTQLTMVIVFLLLVFTAGQFYLTGAISSKDEALKKLSGELNALGEMLSLQKKTDEALRLKASADAKTIAQQLAELESVRRDIEALKQVRQQLEGQVASLAASSKEAQDALLAARDRSKELEAKLSSAEERTALAQKDIAAKDVRLTEREATIAGLNQNIAALKTQLDALAKALDVAQNDDKAKDAKLADLGAKLNLALTRRVEELASYRSEFFGRLRAIIGDRPGIRISGDRFVFQSEILFAPASAELEPAGRARLQPVVEALREIAAKIPSNLNWILEVDGHTDRRPIRNGAFRSNWELSTARAASVVRFLIDEGIPPGHLAAAGYGEFQPVEAADTEAAWARNRRIELKLTQR